MVRLAILSALLLAAASAADLPKGRIIDRVVCSADARQSYALYLPSSYSAARKWPVLYCLEPLARGRVPVERFEAGAEKCGYIVAGSYNSRNGPIAVASEALQAVWRDTHETLSIDDRRAYLAGMSGGARDATAFLASGVFAGVIAQAAGFSGAEVPKDFATPFFGTAGTDDFNYAEMRQVDRELEARGTPHRLVLFAGPHDWAPSSVSADALAWFDLVAIRAGTKPMDRPFIHALFESGTARAKAYEAANDLIGAYLETRSLAADFKGWEDTAALEKKAAELRESREYRKALKAEERVIARHQDLVTKILTLARDLDGSGRQEALASLRNSIADLHTKGDAAQDSDERRVARRVLREATVQAWEQSSVRREKKDYAGAASEIELASLIEPDNSELLYRLAGLYALANDKGRAMSCLKQALEKGLGDRARLQTDPSFDSIRERADFRALAGQATK
jgi:predicted esterase